MRQPLRELRLEGLLPFCLREQLRKICGRSGKLLKKSAKLPVSTGLVEGNTYAWTHCSSWYYSCWGFLQNLPSSKSGINKPFPSILHGRGSWNQHHPNAVYFILFMSVNFIYQSYYQYCTHTHIYIYTHRGTKYMYWMTKKSVDIGWSRLTQNIQKTNENPGTEAVLDWEAALLVLGSPWSGKTWLVHRFCQGKPPECLDKARLRGGFCSCLSLWKLRKVWGEFNKMQGIFLRVQ